MSDERETADLQLPTTAEIHDWIDRAYRRPEGFGPMENDGRRFTRWNMDVAFMAGFQEAVSRMKGNPVSGEAARG